MSFFDYMHEHEKFFKQKGQLINIPKNQYIVTIYDESPWVYFLLDGLIKVSFTLVNGEHRIIGYFIPGMSFAKSGSFFVDSGGNLEYSSVKKSAVYRVPRADFLSYLQKNQKFNQEYTSWLLKSQILLIERIVYQGEPTIERKVIKWLLFMAKYYGYKQQHVITIDIPLTQELIAEFVHATRESVGVVMRKLEQAKLITSKNKLITINDFNKLVAQLDT